MVEAIEAIASEAQRASLRIRATMNGGADEDYDIVEALAESDARLLETLVGCMLVVMQESINAVVVAVKQVDAFLKRSVKGHPGLVCFQSKGSVSKDAVYKTGATCQTPGSTVHVAELVNALANYYKHADEWASITDAHPPTRQVLQAAGLTEKSPRFLTDAANLLAPTNDWGEWARATARALHDWGEQLLAAVEREIR